MRVETSLPLSLIQQKLMVQIRAIQEKTPAHSAAINTQDWLVVRIGKKELFAFDFPVKNFLEQR
jgi:hypothetical protein